MYLNLLLITIIKTHTILTCSVSKEISTKVSIFQTNLIMSLVNNPHTCVLPENILSGFQTEESHNMDLFYNLS